MSLRRAVPILTVSDVAAAASEYATALDLDVVMDHGWIATLGTVNGPQFSVLTRDPTAPCNPDMSIEVTDVDATYHQIRAMGGEIVHPVHDEAWGVRRFFFRTRDGHVVNVLSHRT